MNRNYRRHLIVFAKKMRCNPTRGEATLWYYLRNKQLSGIKFYRQYLIENYIVDFYSRKHHLAIEVDGSIHHHSQQKISDTARQIELETYGVTILRFNEEQVVKDVKFVLERISSQVAAINNSNHL